MKENVYNSVYSVLTNTVSLMKKNENYTWIIFFATVIELFDNCFFYLTLFILYIQSKSSIN